MDDITVTRVLSEAEKMAPFWRFSARIVDTHFGWTPDDFVLGRVFDYDEAYEVVSAIARIDGRITWDALR